MSLKERLLQVLDEYKRLGITEQIDYDKFYLYSLITHSTAIEGSTVTELEAQLLFDEGITAKGKPMMEQLMNLDLKEAYDYGYRWIKRHEDITVDTGRASYCASKTRYRPVFGFGNAGNGR